MTFPLDAVVSVVGFCWLLWWLPSPFPLLPILAAVCFPLYPEDAAFTAYIVSLLMGSLSHAFTLAANWREVRQ